MQGNAAIKTFWYTLRPSSNRRFWHTKAEARLAVGTWLEDRSNRRRRDYSIRMLRPRTLRATTYSDGVRRLTACPPFGQGPAVSRHVTCQDEPHLGGDRSERVWLHRPGVTWLVAMPLSAAAAQAGCSPVRAERVRWIGSSVLPGLVRRA